ncbi:MAG: hypothetical protein WEA99_09185 [Brumimicrobium sp.]
MKPFLFFLAISVFISSCATSKKQDDSILKNDKNYAFEYRPQLKDLPEKLVLNNMFYNYSGGRILDGISTKDGSYLFAGRITRVENMATGRYVKTVGNPFVIKMSKNGEISWKIVVDSVRGNSQLSTVIRENNDYYALLSRDSTVTKINKNGEILEIINLDFKAISMEVVDDEFVFSTTNKKTTSIIWTDEKGNIKKSEEIKNENLRFYNSILVDSKNNYYAYGVYNKKESNSSGIYVYKFSKDGIIWEKEYSISNENKGSLKSKDFSINESNIAIVTNQEAFVIDSSGAEIYRYSKPEGEGQFSSGKLLNDEKILIIQYEYNPNNAMLKRIPFTEEIIDLTNYLYMDDSLSENNNSPRIVFLSTVHNDKYLFLAGAISSGRRESPYLRKIVLDKPAECPKISVTQHPQILSSSEREEVFKEQEWFEDSITFKNTGGALQLINETEKDDKNNIQLKTAQPSSIIYPDQEKTVVFKYNKNANLISFKIHGGVCSTPKYSTINVDLTK